MLCKYESARAMSGDDDAVSVIGGSDGDGGGVGGCSLCPPIGVIRRINGWMPKAVLLLLLLPGLMLFHLLPFLCAID